MSFNKLLKIFSLLFTINLIVNCFYKAVFAENLLSVYLLAKENDPIVLQAKQDQLAFAENLNIAKSKLLPQAYVSMNQNYVKQKDSLNNNPINYNTHNYSLNITQPVLQIVDWMDYSKTKKQILSFLKRYEDIEQELFFRVANQYFSVLAAIDQLETSVAVSKAFRNRLEQATKQFKVGVISITSIKEAQSRLDLAQATELTDKNNLNTEQEKLRQIIGVKVTNFAKLKAQILLMPPNPEQIEPWIKQANKYNLKLQAARYDLEAAREALNASYSNHFPTMQLIGTISNSKSPPAPFNKSINKQITINLQIPIFNGGATVAQNKAAIFQVNAALQTLELVNREAENNARVYFYTVINDIAYIKALDQRVSSSEVALTAIQAGFKAGTRTMVDLLNAESELLIAKKDYTLSKYKYILNGLRLKQATGSLCFQDLEQINLLLEEC